MSQATLLGDAVRRNPYPLYAALRRVRPVLHDRVHDLWLLFDHASVQRALVDHETFSSRAAPPGGGPLDWMIFTDPPRHTKLRALDRNHPRARRYRRGWRACRARQDALP